MMHGVKTFHIRRERIHKELEDYYASRNYMPAKYPNE